MSKKKKKKKITYQSWNHPCHYFRVENVIPHFHFKAHFLSENDAPTGIWIHKLWGLSSFDTTTELENKKKSKQKNQYNTFTNLKL